MRSLSHIVYYTDIGTWRCPIKVVYRKRTDRVRALLYLLHFFPTKTVLGLRSGQIINDYRGTRVRLDKRKLFWLPEEAGPVLKCLYGSVLESFSGDCFFKDLDKDNVRYLSKKWLGCNPKELRK